MKRNGIFKRIKLIFAKLLFWLPQKSKTVRKNIFDAAPNDTLLIANGDHEKFIISTNDHTIAREVFANREFDLSKLRIAINLLDSNHEKSQIIDIGANIGTICIPAIKRGLFETAIAFEPDPYNFNLLQANILINNVNNKITTHNIALGEKDNEIAILEKSSTNYGDHRIKVGNKYEHNIEPEKNLVKVHSESFDGVIGEIDSKHSLIWMDTQGFEGYILSGASKAIMRSVPLVIEFWPYGMILSQAYPSLKSALSKGCYSKIYDLENPSNSIALSEAALDTIWNKLGENGDFTDLLII